MATATAGTTVLSVASVSRSFGARVAVAGVSFELRAGERLAIIGPNGAGKTTLLSMLAGVLEPSAGEVGRLAGGLPGWVPQQPALYAKLSVAENLWLFARLERVADPGAAVARMLEQTALSDRAGEQVARLSGGNQQRLNIALGLLRAPAVLLLDEPAASLDPRQRERLWEFLDGVCAAGTALAFSTHEVREAERHADRVLVLAEGEPLFLGPPSGLGPDLEAGFLDLLESHGH